MVYPVKISFVGLLGFIAGTALGANLNLPIFPFYLTGLLFYFCLSAIKKPAMLLLGIFLTTILAGVSLSGTERINFYKKQTRVNRGTTYELKGTIVTEPEIKGKGQKFLLKSRDDRGKIEVFTNQFPVYKYGDEIQINGDLEKGEGTYYLLNHITHRSYYPKVTLLDSKPTDPYVRIRQKLINSKNLLVERIELYLTEPAAALVNGVLFGIKSGFSDEILGLLVASGTIHIIALSGYNITLIIDFFKKVFTPLGRRVGFLTSTIGILTFVLATGLSPSVIRAAIMGWLWLLGRFLGRQDEAIIPILASAATMLMINPFLISFDVGFQLSFAALLGLIYIAPIFKRFFSAFGNSFAEIISTSLAATLTTWPILAINFGQFSIIAPISNIFILPFVPLLMLFGFILPVVSLFSENLAQHFAYLPWLLSQYVFSVIKYFGNLEVAQVMQTICSPFLVMGYYALLLELYFIKGRSHAKRKIT